MEPSEIEFYVQEYEKATHIIEAENDMGPFPWKEIPDYEKKLVDLGEGKIFIG